MTAATETPTTGGMTRSTIAFAVGATALILAAMTIMFLITVIAQLMWIIAPVLIIGLIIVLYDRFENLRFKRMERQLDIQAKAAMNNVNVQRAQLDLQLVFTENGMYPIPRNVIESGVIAGPSIQLAHRYIQANAVPQFGELKTFNYQPQSQAPQLGVLENHQEQIEAMFQVPSFVDLLNTGQIGDGQNFIIGYNEAGQAFTETWKGMYSCAIGGKSGMGKSTTLRFLVAQCALNGAKLVILDPHGTHQDESLAATLGPALMDYALIKPAIDEKQILDAILYVDEIGRERKATGGRAEDFQRIVVVSDESNVLFNPERHKAANQFQMLMREIAQEYRKYGIYGLCSAQIWTAAATGNNSEIRDSFATTAAHRMAKKQVGMLVDDDDARQVVTKLEPGQMVFTNRMGEAVMLTVPNCDENAINQAFLGSRTLTTGNHWSGDGSIDSSDDGSIDGSGSYSIVPTDQEPDQEPERYDGVFTVREKQVHRMVKQGKTQVQIIEKLWDVKHTSKRPYNRAKAEYEQILAKLMSRVE